ncbi:MAG: N-formylglutamate amidohydrolase [Gammaproteobacteria bacterium]|nr:N-formylglutamate amidohydrolase [Gammaproteobacteria bacterium]
MLASNEPAAFELIAGARDARVIFVCDHASNRMPAALGHLGVPAPYLENHIAWDIGAGAVTRLLRQRFDGAAVFGNYSRLVIDLNRALGDASSIPAISDGLLIPGNLGLSAAEREARAAALHRPYHKAIEELIETRSSGGRMPVFVGIHSFTPKFHGTDRPWHAGMLYDRDTRLAISMLQRLRTERGLVIGDNEPYSGRHTADYTIDTHAETRGIAHVGIEIRQDLIAGVSGQSEWAERLGDALEAALADESLYEPLSAVR